MKFDTLPINQAEGKILAHNVSDSKGKRVLFKGKKLNQDHIKILKDLGNLDVYVVEINSSEVGENQAAIQIAEAISGAGINISNPNVGGVSLKSEGLGVLRVDRNLLNQINQHEELAVATLPSNIVLQARHTAAKVKIIPFAIPKKLFALVEEISNQSPIIYVDLLIPRTTSLILVGSSSAQDRLQDSFLEPLQSRIENLGSKLELVDYISTDEDDVVDKFAEAMLREVKKEADLVILAGETAIMDRNDIAPRAVDAAGGIVNSLGAPVEPGNLLMLAEIDQTPIIGVPGCARSKKDNVVDWLLPRLLVGEKLGRNDIVELGYGGLLNHR